MASGSIRFIFKIILKIYIDFDLDVEIFKIHNLSSYDFACSTDNLTDNSNSDFIKLLGATRALFHWWTGILGDPRRSHFFWSPKINQVLLSPFRWLSKTKHYHHRVVRRTETTSTQQNGPTNMDSFWSIWGSMLRFQR